MELKNSSQSSKVSILLLVAVVCFYCVTLSTKSGCYFASFIVDYIRKCGCIIIIMYIRVKFIRNVGTKQYTITFPFYCHIFPLSWGCVAIYT